MHSAKTVLVVVMCSLALAACTQFRDCGSKEATINSVTVPGCDKGPCIFKKGTDISFTMDFTPNMDIASASTEITAFLGPIPVPFKPDDTKACDFMKCPLKKGVKVTYSQKLPIKSTYPSVTVKVQWKLTDEKTNQAITCFEISAKLE